MAFETNQTPLFDEESQNPANNELVMLREKGQLDELARRRLELGAERYFPRLPQEEYSRCTEFSPSCPWANFNLWFVPEGVRGMVERAANNEVFDDYQILTLRIGESMIIGVIGAINMKADKAAQYYLIGRWAKGDLSVLPEVKPPVDRRLDKSISTPGKSSNWLRILRLIVVIFWVLGSIAFFAYLGFFA